MMADEGANAAGAGAGAPGATGPGAGPGAPGMVPGMAPMYAGMAPTSLMQQQAQVHTRQAHIQQQHSLAELNTKLTQFWVEQQEEVQGAADFKNHLLPLARIKKIMKSDEDVRMISAEAPVLFAKACEMFILELTHRAWAQTEEAKRRTLQRSDISTAIQKTDIFDFLIDIVPRDDPKKEDMRAMAGAVDPSHQMQYYMQNPGAYAAAAATGAGGNPAEVMYPGGQQQAYASAGYPTGPNVYQQGMMNAQYAMRMPPQQVMYNPQAAAYNNQSYLAGNNALAANNSMPNNNPALTGNTNEPQQQPQQPPQS